MAEDPRVKIEVERVVNLVTALGWSKVEERLEDGKITLTVEKKLAPVGGG